MPITSTFPTLCWSVAANPSPLGVRMHNAGYAALGLPFTYVALGADDVEPVVAAMRAIGVRGLGVSMPHKVRVLDFVDEVNDDVRAIGACNTVVNTDGHLAAYNTDWRGVQGALGEVGLERCSSALVVGAGGAARAAAFALRDLGMEVTVAARNVDQAAQLATELALAGAVGLDAQGSVSAELVLNATPASECVDLDAQPEARGVLDVVFRPAETVLTEAARARGLAVATGPRMLLHQALFGFELYTGRSAPIDVMDDALQAGLAAL